MQNVKTGVWIVVLAFLSVGARNFEDGMSIDGPLYAAISRNIARSGEWFVMNTSTPHFIPFAEHPHLGFWIQAFIFKLLPMADWSARISGHLFYIAFLGLFFSILHQVYNKRVATLGVLSLWIWGAFSNYFSTFYIDPGALFFGSLFLYLYYLSLTRNGMIFSVGAGTCLALCFMTKGFLGLAFGPTAAALFLYKILRPLPLNRGRLIWQTFFTLLNATLVFMVYILLIKQSQVPHFLDLYYDNQIKNRFAVSWRWLSLMGWDYWYVLFKHSYGLVCLAPCAFFIKSLREPQKHFLWLGFIFFMSFTLMFAPAHRIGGQYLLYLLPPAALFVAVVAGYWLPASFSVERLMNTSGAIALAAVLLIQYLPFRTHGRLPPPETAYIKEFLDENKNLPRVLHFDTKIKREKSFITVAPYAWYADVEIVYDTDDNYDGLRLIWEPSLNPEDKKCLIKSFGNRHLIHSKPGGCST